jgi:hypothetical protein
VKGQLGRETTNDPGYINMARILPGTIPQLARACENSGAARTLATTESRQIHATLGDKQEARAYSGIVKINSDEHPCKTYINEWDQDPEFGSLGTWLSVTLLYLH